MRSAVVVFPGSNCDRDMAVALEQASGRKPVMVWHKETELPDGLDVVALPGGFSFGDYLRCGAIAARAPIMEAVARHAARGALTLGICNGWQVMIEAGILPGALLRNASLKFVCRDVRIRVERADTPFTSAYAKGAVIRAPVAHHDGAFFAEPDMLRRLDGEGRIVFRYVDAEGRVSDAGNPNGSADNIAGLLSADGRALGMMPHPERLADPALGGDDGAGLFKSLVESVAVTAA